jgi:hypothetical protein
MEKIVLIIFSILILMQEKNSLFGESILGKKIDQLDIKNDNNLMLVREHEYRLNSELGFYHGKPIARLGFYTDIDEKITSINGMITLSIDKTFLESLVNTYGNPDYMVKPDNLMETKRVHVDKASMREGYGTTKKVTFEDDPLFIVWKKEEYELWIQPNYKKEYISITYKIVR